ncbi:type IV pilus modification protein PilV [Glaciimonas immobilis]|uniref:Type IV pilus assembly protein PilV n=1 Tax=Glaciimonas immobilis TaxID=728004 RepID=A0A840RSE2_9BURK|nr:type IV pilus modification protein PilV [Glaciimonas immobilis]KAF3997699.1 type IV pilus modification protein PilV [Glaciimonas immobilis]MBB5200583.1 type IV pilus assembly protein PilV [Glaciimonas immobilis]
MTHLNDPASKGSGIKSTNKSTIKSTVPQCKQCGVGMIEVLIALLISAFGLLGLAGLEVISLKYQTVAHFRSLASQTSADMADRIRANVNAAQDGHYFTQDSYPLNTLPIKQCMATIDPCNAQEIAAADLYHWRNDLQKIAGGWGNVTGDVTNGMILTVYFYEPDIAGGGAKGIKCEGAGKLSIRCFKTVFLP